MVNVGKALTRSTSRERRLREAEAMALSAGLMVSRYSRPWSVSSIFLPRRRNSFTPSQSSSALIWWLIAPCVTDSSSAACVKLNWRPADSKARMEVSGGSLGFIVKLPHNSREK